MSEIDRAANPTTEEAIKYLERMLFTQDFSPSTLRAKAVNTMAIEALREQAERENGCERCSIFANDPKWLCSGGNGQYESLTYRFCPMCGRRLEVK